MSVSEGGAHACHNVLYANTTKGDDVHISLNQNQVVESAVFSLFTLDKVDAVHSPALVKDFGICGVFILCHILFAVINSSAECHHVAHAVKDRHDDSAGKCVNQFLTVDKSAVTEILN